MTDRALSPHFHESEFRCHHCGQLPLKPINSSLILGLEALRSRFYPHGLVVVSGYRCPAYQAQLHAKEPTVAAKDSQHVLGAAADVTLVAPLDEVKQMGVFSGIGWQYSNGHALVRHVDVRHASGHNTTGGTIHAPTVWQYS